MKYAKIPSATITRLSMYSRTLERSLAQNEKIISSERLAKLCEVNPAQIRKDLAYFGEFGVRGVGYHVPELLFEIKRILGLNRRWCIGIVGVGNLGLALIANENFAKQGYTFVAAFDNNPQKISKRLPNGLVIHHMDDLAVHCKETEVELGIIATPGTWAQDIAHRFIKAEVHAILNFAPIPIHVPPDEPPGFWVENVDFTVRLDKLAYRLTSS
jgi:redox-sensing transcriptional repressor